MIGYLIPNLRQHEAPQFLAGSRLAGMGRWSCLDDLHTGTIVHLQGWSSKVAQENRKTVEGWSYMPMPHLQPLSAFLREDRPPSQELLLSNGSTVLLPLAQLSPRRAIFSPGGGKWGPYMSDWALSAFRIWSARQDRTGKDGKTYPAIVSTEEEVIDVVFRCLAQCYQITHELATDLVEMSDHDLVNALYTIWGYDPKALASGGGSSPLPLADSVTESSSLPANTSA